MTNEGIKGVWSLIASAMAFSLMSICVKKLSGEIPLAEMIFVRALFSIIFTFIMLKHNSINIWGKQKKLLVIRGLLGTGALFFIFKSLTTLPIATATIIQYTYPTFTALNAYFILKEKLKKTILLSIFIGWIGIILVIQPSFINQTSLNISILSLIFAILGAFLTSLAYICVRKLSKNEHPLVIIYYFPLISLPISLPFIINNLVIPEGIQWLWISGIGVFTQIGQIFITQGLKALPATQACSFNYTQVIFSSVWGVLLFKESISIYLGIGGACVLISTIISINSINKTTQII